MTCSPERIELLFDGELDAAQQAEARQHIAECSECGGLYAQLVEQRAEIRAAAPHYKAPEELRQSVRAALRREIRPASATFWRPLAIAASLLLVASAGWNIVQLRSRSAAPELAQVILDDHISSLVGSHLLDVVSSDQHTVKPWFAGKLDFSPDVRDLAERGFPLAGARVDYIGGRRVAALVYHRRQHVITVFIWPGAGESETALSRNGYNLLRWSAGPMTYWAVSDVSAAELRSLQPMLQ
jgi:anti-sigma factor RsiW